MKDFTLSIMPYDITHQLGCPFDFCQATSLSSHEHYISSLETLWQLIGHRKNVNPQNKMATHDIKKFYSGRPFFVFQD